MARRFALHFDVRVVVEADDADGARAALEQGVEDLAAAHELAEDAEECTEAAAVADALAEAIRGDVGSALSIVELDEDAL